jgi:hypothetical protein
VGIGFLTAALAIAGAGCGKKGPPLAPFVRIPAAVETLDARRVGHDVYVTLTVPAENIDASTPADVRRVEVYGYTGATPPVRGRFLQGGVAVATVDVPPAAAPGERPSETPPPTLQGMPITVLDTLTPDELAAPPPADQAGAPGAAPAGPPRRFYMAIAFSERGVPGPPGRVIELPLAPLPEPPAAPSIAYTAAAVTLSWERPGALVASLFERALPREPPPAGLDARSSTEPPPPPQPEGPTLYNVYRETAPDPLVLPAPAGDEAPVAPPLPLNPMPLAGLTYTDPVSLDERERCYTVRAVRGAPPAIVEGEASPRACVRPIDVFAPAAPAGLATIASANAISLIWEPGTEPDLAGYLVLRGEAGGDTLTPLTPEPIPDAQFTDDRVAPGVRYVYRVIAVDRRLPLPNASAPAIIEETAR